MTDLFLEFTNRQIRRYYGLYELELRQHEEILARWINIAAWICEEVCLIPIGFPLECAILRSVLRRKRMLLEGRLIQLPMRSIGFGSYVIRRRDQYSPYRNDFQDLYRDESADFVEQFSVAFRDRVGRSADSLVEKWRAGPDRSPLWRPVKRLGSAAIARISKIPELIRRHDAGIVWNGIEARLNDADRYFADDLQRIHLSDFVGGYCDEYKAETLRELPYGWRDLRLGITPPGLVRYPAFVASLAPFALREIVERMDAAALIRLRSMQGFLAFKEQYELLADDLHALRASAARAAESTLRLVQEASRSLPRIGPDSEIVLTEKQIQLVDLLLGVAANAMRASPSHSSILKPYSLWPVQESTTGRIERRLAAIFSADVADYSRLMGLDEEGTFRQLQIILTSLIEPKLQEYHGRKVKDTGDGVLVEFASSVAAVRCAIDVQHGMAVQNKDVAEDKRIEFRIGINVDDIIEHNGDIFGEGVNVAARIQSIAEPGTVWISENVYRQVKGKLPLTFIEKGERHLKNIAQPVRTYMISDG